MDSGSGLREGVGRGGYEGVLEWVGQRGERKCVEGRNVGGVWWTVGVGGQWEWVEGGGGG